MRCALTSCRTCCTGEDIESLGALLTEQWRLWKIVTGETCTNDFLEYILKGAEPFLSGAKVNGVGMGGAILFLVQAGKRDQLVAYLRTFDGAILDWQLDTNGYELREWYDPATLATFVRHALPNLLQARSSYERHGTIVDCEAEAFVHRSDHGTLVGPLDPALFDVMADLPLSVLGTAGALVCLVGTATAGNLRSIKKCIDATASAVFADEMEHWQRKAPVGTTEGKDEYGEVQPTVRTSQPELSGGTALRTAVDVVDGTTLSATGQPGAYSICAVGEGLRSFPDMQAYAILAPTALFNELDMAAPPEFAPEHNLNVIARALGKRVNELVIVTHSEDTGVHHRTLIQKMRMQGVSVIVPDPVIVEPPYVVAACSGGSPGIDGMIGVFGLPEIAITTVLCGILNRGKGCIFRLASNAPMRCRDQTTLDGILDLTAEERMEAARYALSPEKLYAFTDIASGPGCMFAAAAITDDPILGLRGVTKEGNHITVEGCFADPCGNAHRLAVCFARPNLIDYTARYPLPLCDISLVVDLAAASHGTETFTQIERLASHICRSFPGVFVPPLVYTGEGDPGLHLTLYEFVVDYASSANLQTRNALFGKATSIVTDAIRERRSPYTALLGAIHRTSGGVLIDVELDDQLNEMLHRIDAQSAPHSFFPHPGVPRHAHITLARFTEVLSDDIVQALDQLLCACHGIANSRLEIPFLLLQCAASTPFRDIQQSIVLPLNG